MTTYNIEPVRETLHGTFSREYPAILTIDSGDTVRFRTLISSWITDYTKEPPEYFEPRAKERDGGHALCGPVAIRGAEPGMTLEIRINDVRPAQWGLTTAGGRDSAVNRHLGLLEQRSTLVWSLDAAAMTGRDQYGHTLALAPFMGVMGMPPDEPGIHLTAPPRFCGGNLDCKELIAGSTLYLPISVPQALFSVGDGHAIQGDGEVCGVAIECPMEYVDLTFHVHDQVRLTTPHARTATAWITLGVHKDLHEASLIALEAMIDLMSEQYQIPRSQALGLASLVVDLRVTQIVNGVLGVHAVLPYDAIK